MSGTVLVTKECCATCWDYSNKGSLCFCPLNRTHPDLPPITRPTNLCYLYRAGKNDYPFNVYNHK